MRASWSLVAATAVVAALVLVDAPETADEGGGRLLAAGADGTAAGWPDRFDGRLHADADSGCIRPWPEDGPGPPGDELTLGPDREGVRPPVVVQLRPPFDDRPEPPPGEGSEWFPDTFRGPWPICDHPATRTGQTDDR